MKTVIYARVSTGDQSCATQLEELRAYCAARKWQIDGEYVDHGVSGAKVSRPQLDRMMSDARKRKFDCICVWKLDRFGRSVVHLAQAMHELDALGVRFVAITQGIDTDSNNPTSRLLLNILACVAQFERELIMERLESGRKHAREYGTKSGKAFGRPRRVFRRDLAAELRLKGMSIREISSYLEVPVSTVALELKNRKTAETLDDLVQAEVEEDLYDRVPMGPGR